MGNGMAEFQHDLTRLEAKIDKLADAVMHLARIEERLFSQIQTTSAINSRVEQNEKRLRAAEDSLNKWINRGIGAWAVAGGLTTGISILNYFH